MPDGAHCMAIGKIGWLPNLVAVIGGNCSVTVIDAEGTEVFWTVVGDVVKSLAIHDFDGDGENEVRDRSQNNNNNNNQPSGCYY